MSSKQTLSITLVLLLLAGAINTASAANVRWLKDSALSKMTAEDMEILRSAARNVLDYGPDNESRRWENTGTGARGVVTPLDSFEQDGMFCRRLEAFSEVAGVSGRGVYVFCRQEDGTWRIPASSSR
jgi:surface antigen